MLSRQIKGVELTTFCISGGKTFSFYFYPDWTLTEWKAHNWSNAC
jgi:hypothetical protein